MTVRFIRPNTRPAPSRQTTTRTAIAALAVLLCSVVCACPHYTPYYGDYHARWADWVSPGDVAYRLLLIGDCGNPDPKGEPALEMLAEQVNEIPDRTTVVFLGDNIYESGMPLPAPSPDPITEAAVGVAKVLVSEVFQTRQEAERKINAQIDVVRGNRARAVFVPGNHDWDQFAPTGRERILALDDYLEGVHQKDGVNVSLIPSGGCPGPVSMPLGKVGELIVLDTQWWLETRAADKATPENNPAECPYTTEHTVRDALRDELEKAAAEGRPAIVVGHHPLATKGAHSGFVDPWSHLFPARIGAGYVPVYVEWMPMPIIGTAIVELRRCCSPSAQDVPNRINRHMRASIMRPMIEAAEHGAAPLAYVAGHDHSLQVFRSAVGPPYLLVSGLGSSVESSVVGDNSRTLFAHSNKDHTGFMQMDFLKDGRVRLSVIEYGGKDLPPFEMYSTFLAKPDTRTAKVAGPVPPP